MRINALSIEVLFKNKRGAAHVRSYRNGEFITCAEHMPKAHQKYLEWTPSRIIRWAQNSGPNTEKLVTQITQRRNHPQQGFRACMGIMRLGKRFTDLRLENACTRAIAIGAYSYKSVESILKKSLDKQPLLSEQPKPEPVAHPNLRGHRYYQRKEK